LLILAALAWSSFAAAQAPDPAMDRALAGHRTFFASNMNTIMQEAREAFGEASLAARVCDKQRLERQLRYLERLRQKMEAEQSSWLPPYGQDFDPNLWAYVHVFLMHATEQAAQWMKIDCTFPDGGLGQPQIGDPAARAAQIADDIDWWNSLNHEQWFEQAERLRLKGDCAAWREQLDRIERELRRALSNPTGPVDELEARVERWQRLWHYLMDDVRKRHCPAGAGEVTPESTVIDRRAHRSTTPPPAFDQVPHQHYSPPAEPNKEQRNNEGGQGPTQAAAPSPAPPTPPPPAQQGLPVRPAYEPIQFPTVPSRFCSQEEYNRFLIEVINPQYLKAAENAEKAARFRAAVEAAINTYVQAGQPVPTALLVLRRQAAEDYAEQQRLSDEIARLRDRVRQTPIVDCGGQVLRNILQMGIGAMTPDQGQGHASASRHYARFKDARERCDRSAMDAALRDLEEDVREARDRFQGIADSMQGGPMDQADTPENNEYAAASGEYNEARRLLEKARAEARTCPRATEPPQPQSQPPIERGGT
jgi:hypothetical protein